jgi:hypothetical protein
VLWRRWRRLFVLNAAVACNNTNSRSWRGEEEVRFCGFLLMLFSVEEGKRMWEAVRMMRGGGGGAAAE